MFILTNSEFEEYTRARGLALLLEEAKQNVGSTKARIGRYWGARIDLGKVPVPHMEYLRNMVSLGEQR